MSRLALASRIGFSSLLLAAAPAVAADVVAPAVVPKELPAEAKAERSELIGFAFGARLQSDYNFRGISQSNHEPSPQTYGEVQLFDNFLYGSTQDKAYPRWKSCGKQPSDLKAKMGLSRGWGDIYRSTLPDQYIEVTGLTSGRYRLLATADADNWFLESDDSNNFTWIDLQLNSDSVRVVQHGPYAPPIG